MVQFYQLIHNVYIGTMQSSNSMCSYTDTCVDSLVSFSVVEIAIIALV